MLRLVFFDGSKAFLGVHSSYWVLEGVYLWVQVASFIGLGIFFLLLFLSRVVLGDVAFKWGGLTEALVNARKSPISEPRVVRKEEELNKKFWKRNFVAVLNAL